MTADRFTLPETPEEWAAVPEKRSHADYELSAEWTYSDGAPHNWLDLASASRLLEHERCVERLKDWLFLNCTESIGLHSEAWAEARRILGAE